MRQAPTNSHYHGRVTEPDQPRSFSDTEPRSPSDTEPRSGADSEPTGAGPVWVRKSPATPPSPQLEDPSPSADEPGGSDEALDDDSAAETRSSNDEGLATEDSEQPVEWGHSQPFTPVPPISAENLASTQSAAQSSPSKPSTLARLRGTTHPPEHLSTIERLRDGQRALSDRLVGWIVTLAITGVAFAIRFINLGYPKTLVFDETYYAKDAWTLWIYGYEGSWPDRETADPKVASGVVDIFNDTPEFIAHPPLGKWLIGLGEQVFGMNAFGWRIMPLIFGTLLVLMTIRMARRLSRSTLIGGIAGLLITFDGLAFVMSRVALLDIFQAFFLVAGVAAVVADRDWYRGRLATVLEARRLPDFAGRFGRIIWLRPWRTVAGVMFGLAIATKWNSLFVLAAMGVLSVLWDVGARRLAGADFRSWLALLIDGIPAFIRLVVVSALVYVASWWGWLTTSGGYDRDWGTNNPDNPLVKAFGEMWASLIHYHQEIYGFHTGEGIKAATHAYNAHPAGWLLMIRPIGIDATNNIAPGTDGCPAGGEACMRVISGMGTPVLWWMAFIALIVGLVWWIGGRDWRFGVPIVAAMSTYLFWFPNSERPVFFFYAICIIPFTVTLLAMVMGLILGPKDGPRRKVGAIIVGVAIAAVLANFAYIYPVLTDSILLRSEYYARMWLQSWI